jgi:hypothetical protein
MSPSPSLWVLMAASLVARSPFAGKTARSRPSLRRGPNLERLAAPGAAARRLLRLRDMPENAGANGWRGMARVSRIVGAVALAGTLLSACGARSWLPVDDTPSGVGEDDGAACTEVTVPVEPNVPNLYFVLDISGSMLMGDKWTNVRSAASSLIRQLGPNARFGATVFPAPGPNQCAAGVEVMPLRLGDTQGVTANAFSTATALTPNGGTPTAATFRSLVPKFRNLPGISFAILATDGGPNCNSNIVSCSLDQCTRNIDSLSLRCLPNTAPNCCDPTQMGSGGGCLDSDAATQAVSDLRAIGVPTYVMGIPGSSPYGPVLDQLAIAGGTARAGQPLYYAVNSADETALASAFEDIASQAMKSCVLKLGHAVANPKKVNVYVDGMLVPSGGGWSLNGQAVTLEGSACESLQSDQADAATPIRVVEGCPTVN